MSTLALVEFKVARADTDLRIQQEKPDDVTH